MFVSFQQPLRDLNQRYSSNKMFLLFQKAQSERLLIEGESAIEGIDEFGRGSCALLTSSIRGHYGLQAIR